MKSTRRALAAATAVSFAVIIVWSLLAVATASGPPPPGALAFWHHPDLTTYLALAAAGTGGGSWLPLAAVLSGIYMLALLSAGRRGLRRYEPPLYTPPEDIPGAVWWHNCEPCGGLGTVFAGYGQHAYTPEPPCPHCHGTGGRWEFYDGTPAPPPRRERT